MKIKTVIESAVSFGAAIVVLGALFKLEHLPFASTFLWIGLVTEAIIFSLYGLMEWFKKPEIQSVTTAAPKQVFPNEDKELKETMKSIDDTLKRIFRV